MTREVSSKKKLEYYLLSTVDRLYVLLSIIIYKAPIDSSFIILSAAIEQSIRRRSKIEYTKKYL